MGLDARVDKFGGLIHIWGLIGGLLRGAKFTCSNFQENPSLSRMDRFLFYNEWEELFPGRFQIALPRLTSDHMLILLDFIRAN